MIQLQPGPSIAIRSACASDEAAILDICLRTADRGEDGTHHYSDPRLPGFLWALPYVRLCPQNAFVLTRNDEVMGYCLAAPNTASYEARLVTDWWPFLRLELEHFSPKTQQDENILAYVLAEPKTPPQIIETYPAHLHINLLPEVQKGGNGSMLLRHQLQALQDSGSAGVHLGIDPRHESVTGFYRKAGFIEIGRNPSIIMGKRLDPKA